MLPDNADGVFYSADQIQCLILDFEIQLAMVKDSPNPEYQMATVVYDLLILGYPDKAQRWIRAGMEYFGVRWKMIYAGVQAARAIQPSYLGWRTRVKDSMAQLLPRELRLPYGYTAHLAKNVDVRNFLINPTKEFDKCLQKGAMFELSTLLVDLELNHMLELQTTLLRLISINWQDFPKDRVEELLDQANQMRRANPYGWQTEMLGYLLKIFPKAKLA